MSPLQRTLWSFWIIGGLALSSGNAHHGSMSISDYMMRIQCRAKCLTTELETDFCDYEKCFAELKASKKLGSCPKRLSREAVAAAKNDTLFYILTSNCIDACGGWDYRCPEAEKCCWPNSCGSTCHRPTDLERIKALPTIPLIHSVTESRYRSIEICWDIYTEIKNKTLFFVISGRSHVGSLFASHKLSDWIIFNGSPRYDHIFRENSRETARRWCFILKIKPGRWYQFRVASVNENGTRGFSKHSTEIQLKDIKGNKFPKPPRDLVIGPLHSDRNSSLLSALLTWNQPKTQIPIDKYKIFWSRHLPGVINSVSMQHATVHEPQRHFQFRHLAPNSIYFIQVQSISVFGQKRLRSKKESRTLNTTIESHHLHVRHLTKANLHLLVRFLISKSHELVVKVQVHPQHHSNYSHYQMELCQGPIHCLDKVTIGEYRTVNTSRSSFEFLDLNFNTLYSLRLKSYHKWSISEPKLAHRTFMTPDCSTFKQKHNIKLLDCENK